MHTYTRRCRSLKATIFGSLFIFCLTLGQTASAFQASSTQNTIGAATYRNATVTSTSLVITTTVAAPAGSVIVVTGASNNATGSTPTFTVADSASNTYTIRNEGCGGPGSVAGDGVCGFIATATTPNALAIESTITITLSTGSLRIAGQALYISGVSENFRSSGVADTTTTVATTASVTAATVNSGDIVVGVVSVEDSSNTVVGDSDTTNGSWSTTSVSASSNGGLASEVTSIVQYKTASASGSQTYDVTHSSSDNHAMIIVLSRMATPDAITNLVATPQNTQVALSWTAANSNDSPITDYIIEYKTSASATWLVFSDGTSSAASATVTGLTNGTAYDFRVTGINAVGTSDLVAPTTSSTPRTVPTAPSNISASPKTGPPLTCLFPGPLLRPMAVPR